jgi:hypothetical protein
VWLATRPVAFKEEDIMRIEALLLSAFMAFGFASAKAGTIFETGTLGPTGVSAYDVSLGNPPGINISRNVFSGVRFHLSSPAITTEVGGHFAGPYSDADTFFGAIVRLTGEDDFPDSEDFSTPDVLGATLLHFTEPSSEVYGDLSLELDPGWHALVFGSGLFGAEGHGAAVLNNIHRGEPSYIGLQADVGWGSRDLQLGKWYAVNGTLVPEPAAAMWVVLLVLGWIVIKTNSRMHVLM